MKKKNNSIKKFFNKPAPIIIVLVVIILFLLLYIANYNSKNRIYVGLLDKDNVQIANIHYFTNGDMNYFYASPALYKDKDIKVYSYNIGYYVEGDDKKVIPFATRSYKLENKSSLKEIVDEMSSWSFAETANNPHFFKKEVRNKLDKLHFVIKASSIKDSKDYDINIDYAIDETKITK